MGLGIEHLERGDLVLVFVDIGPPGRHDGARPVRGVAR